VFERFRMRREPLAIRVCAAPRAKSPKSNLGGDEVRLGFLHDAAKRFESLAVSIDHRANARIEWRAAQIIEPGNAYSFEAAVERRGEPFSGFVDGKRCARIGPC